MHLFLHESLKHRPTYHGSVGALPPPVVTMILILCTQVGMAVGGGSGGGGGDDMVRFEHLSPIAPAGEPEEPFNFCFMSHSVVCLRCIFTFVRTDLRNSARSVS